MTSAPWISGVVVRGDSRGKALGFPTANLVLDRLHEQPADGIYAARVRTMPATTEWPAVAHVGPRPTFAGASATVEVHLLNFPDQSLYGQTLLVQFLTKIREVQKFATVPDLIAAIQDDCQKALEILQ
ncbi:MAG: riboflavin kinase [Candidatus Andersenbacteria bacterium]